MSEAEAEGSSGKAKERGRRRESIISRSRLKEWFGHEVSRLDGRRRGHVE